MPVELVVTLAIYAVLWQGYQLRRRLTGFGHLVLLAAIIAAVANPALQRMIEAGWFGEVDPGAKRFYGALIVIVGSTMGLYLFRLAVDRYGPRSPRVIRFVVLSLGLLAGWIVMFALATSRGQTMLYGPAAFAHTPGLLYFATTGPYLFLVRLLVVIWIVRRTRAADVTPALRWGTRVAGVGLLVAGLVSLLRAIPPIVILFGGPVTAAPPGFIYVASTVGSPLIFAGLSFPLVVGRLQALRAGRRNRRSYARIEPLWQISTTAFPEVELRSVGPLDYQLRRRRAECLDALYYLRAGQPDRDGDPGQLAAADQLEVAIAKFKRTRLDNDRLWSLVDQHRHSPTGDTAADPPTSDHDLLEQLADLVSEKTLLPRT
ncbi:MAB_1171c family putative transporter [Pseudonocardia sp. ICBG1142]|uniref:MAB_1171c family putative transporter n=1 Tax=Pseudonocardia sp. ICBG1142 TaxID=2846760 RepID=UPI001CF6FFB2|nr:MAB_1171c family putative transporter [Pseudonocardia sp. ICBG1142]